MMNPRRAVYALLMELAGFILAVVITLIVLIAFISVGLIRSRKRAWQQFARRYGLVYESGATGIGVHGTVDGRPFRLFTSEESSDVGPMGIQEVRMQIRLRGELPAETRISRVEGLVGAVDRMASAEAVPTGDEQFDSVVLVESASPEQAKAYLTPQRRELIRKLVSDSQADDAGVDDAHLFIQDREMLTNLKRVEQRLELMLRLAPGLDGTERSFQEAERRR
jgi:hypothetical protein